MSKRVLADNIKWLIGSTLILFLLGCSSESSRKDRIEVDASEISSQELAKEGIQTARQIFYSLPSPLETAMILKRSGAQYNEELLNPVDNASKYTTNKSMALNLGIYSTDLSYASLFDQTQASIKYMAVSKRMAEGLGILNAIDNTIVQRLEENVNNREAIMDIIEFQKKTFGIYHFSNYPETTWFEFASKIKEFSGSEVNLKSITTEEFPTPAKRPKRSTMSLEKIEKDYNIEPKHWENSLRDCVEILKLTNA